MPRKIFSDGYSGRLNAPCGYLYVARHIAMRDGSEQVSSGRGI
ncbi:hypothetical protein BN440_2535 [Erwinia amylovora MR1]|nr:hypothetical protein BN440_2535 [Erwinia amylovora MR1]